MVVISVSIPDRLLARLDEAVERLGYRSRSELIREAIEQLLATQPERSETGITVVLVLSNHEAYPGVDQRIIAHVTRYAHHVKALYHQQLDQAHCLTILLLENTHETIILIKRIRSTKGVIRVLTAQV